MKRAEFSVYFNYSKLRSMSFNQKSTRYLISKYYGFFGCCFGGREVLTRSIYSLEKGVELKLISKLEKRVFGLD